MQDNCRMAENELVCPTCKNKIANPCIVRCPRCYTLLLKTGCNGNCKGCGGKSQVQPA